MEGRRRILAVSRSFKPYRLLTRQELGLPVRLPRSNSALTLACMVSLYGACRRFLVTRGYTACSLH